MMTDDGAEHTHLHGPIDVARTTQFATTLQLSVLVGSCLIGVVTLIADRTSIEERSNTANHQGGLVVAHAIRTSEIGTGLTVLEEAVGEEQRVGRRIETTDVAALAHEAIVHLHGILHLAVREDDDMLKNHAIANEAGSIGKADNADIDQTHCTLHLRIGTEMNILDFAHIAHEATILDDGSIATNAFGIFARFLMQHSHKFGFAACLNDLKGSLHRGQAIVENHFKTAVFLQHTDLNAIGKGSVAACT